MYLIWFVVYESDLTLSRTVGSNSKIRIERIRDIHFDPDSALAALFQSRRLEASSRAARCCPRSGSTFREHFSSRRSKKIDDGTKAANRAHTRRPWFRVIRFTRSAATQRTAFNPARRMHREDSFSLLFTSGTARR